MTATLDLPDRARREVFTEDDPSEEFGWIEWLSPRHMRLFAVELNAALAAPSVDKITALLDSWKATAELDHSPELQQMIDSNRQRNFESVDEWLRTAGTR